MSVVYVDTSVFTAIAIDEPSAAHTRSDWTNSLARSPTTCTKPTCGQRSRVRICSLRRLPDTPSGHAVRRSRAPTPSQPAG